MSLNRFLCLNTHSTFVKPWLLQFFFCVWKILHLYSFRSVYCGCYLYPVSILLCNAGVKSHKLYSSGSFARFHQWTTLAGDVEEGEKPSLTHFFFFFLLWMVALEAAVPLPLSQLFKWYSPPLFLLLRWQLVPRWGPSSLVSLGFGKLAGLGAASCSYLFGFLRLPPFIFPASPNSVTNSLY